MSSTLLEQTRALHEEIERLESQAVRELAETSWRTERERVAHENRVSAVLDRVQDTASRLSVLYQDTDGLGKRELDSISGGPDDVPRLFYRRLDQLRAEYSKMPDMLAEEPTPLDAAAPSVAVPFSGEESHGRYLDLHKAFATFKTLFPTEESLTYPAFLTTFWRLDTIDLALKQSPAYHSFVTDLLNSLCDFLRRTRPLTLLEPLLAKQREQFEAAWEAGKVPGFASTTSDLFCVPCDKLFAKQSVYDAHLNGKKHRAALKRAAATGSNGASASAQPRHSDVKDLAWIETQIAYLCTDVLADVIAATKGNVERKQARTYDEMVLELEEEERDATDAQGANGAKSDEEEEMFYNPLNLPMGWDGKPIPYWLYKLHGLNIEYKCEICGNEVYKGPRNFERHFQEARHVYGMKCLQIPNTRHFHGVTSINDAYALLAKLKEQEKSSAFDAENEEEFETPSGDVLNKKTYEDLRRQGLL